MEQPLLANVEKLLNDLRSKEAHVRKTAVEELGKSNMTDERILNALNLTTVTDSNQYVRSAAAQSYLALTGKALPQEQGTAVINATPLKEVPPRLL